MAGVYLLRDPVSGIVRYVGQTANLKRRMYEHKTIRKSRVCGWIEELLLQGLEPLVEFIAVPTKIGRDRVEKKFVINYFSTVFNGTSGGTGLFTFADDVIARKTKPSSVFCRCRDRWAVKIKNRLYKKGWNKYHLERSTGGGIAWQILRSSCIHALKAAKNRKINCGAEYDEKHLSDVYCGPDRQVVLLENTRSDQ